MYTAEKTELARLRTYERELTGLYGEAILRHHMDEAKAIFARRQHVRDAVQRAEEWRGESGTVIQFPRVTALDEELARAV